MTHSTDTERTAPGTFEDRKWYWVAYEGWGRAPDIIAPALYKAECDAWYSFEFSGISTRFLKVLEPCRRAPAAPAPIPCRVNPMYHGPSNCQMGTVRCSVDSHRGRGLPPGWKAVPVELTDEMIRAGGHANSEWLNDNAPIGEARYAMPMKGVYAAILAAAPSPPAAAVTTGATDAMPGPEAPTPGAAEEQLKNYVSAWERAFGPK